jgi:hypothetical protein
MSKKTKRGLTEVAKVATEGLLKEAGRRSESSKLTELLNRAAQLPKPEVPSAKEKTPSLKQEEAAGRLLVKQLMPHFEALMSTKAQLEAATKGDGNLFATEANRMALEKRLQEQENELQPFFDEAPGLRKTLEMKFEDAQKRAVAEQATQTMIERVKKIAEDNFAGGVTPGRVSVFLEKCSRMIGVLDRVPAEKTEGLDPNSKKVIAHRFSQDISYTGFMADFRKEAVAKAKASGMTEGYVKGEVVFKADEKDPRPGMIAIGIARAKEKELKARKTASSNTTK